MEAGRVERARAVEFRVLGGVEALVDGQPLAVDGRRSREVLALLLLHAGETVARADLVDGVWGDDAPLTVDASLRVAISKLRKAFDQAGARDLIETRPTGYILRADPGAIDAWRFEAAAGEGRQALASGRFEEASDTLRDALRTWRGTPYADVAHAAGASTEARRLAEIRLEAEEDLVEADLARGRHDILVAELERLVEQQPTRERRTRQLMLALYRSGRQADALDAYRRTAARLRDELGLEPGPELRALEQAILRQDASLEGPPAAPAAAPHAARAPRRLVVAAGGATLALALAAALVVVATTGGAASGLRPDQVGAFRGGSLERAIDVGARPAALAADDGQLWVANGGDGTLTRIDIADGEARDVVPVGGQPSGIAAADGSVWVVESTRGELVRVNAGTGRVVQRIRVGVRPAGVAVDGRVLWVVNGGDGSVQRLDATTGRSLGTTAVAAEPTGVAAGAGGIWVAHDASGLVTRLDRRTGAPVAAVAAGSGARALTVAYGSVWVANAVDGTVSRIDPARNAVTATVDVGGEPFAITAHDGAIWVADAGGALAEIAPEAAQIVRRIGVGQSPAALASTEETLWVAALPGTAETGATLRVDAFGIPGIDPADGPPLADVDVLRLVYDGLVAYRAAEGAAGNAVVPNLAQALPIAAPNGRTYTFTLREGIAFADGAPLRASDVERSLERALTLEWGEIMLGSIEEVTADDASGTVVLRLRERDPDLLYKLALPVAAVLPASAGLPLRAPVPGTGPYRIETYAPGRRIVLVRNERFRSWSETARPHGLADRIVVRFVEDPVERRDDVLAGRADLASIGLVPGADLVRSRYASQVYRWSAAYSHFLFLNTREAPFDDVRVRRAVALAVDRRQVVATFGGPDVASPTCQHIPPTIPGYSPYCPFARSSGTLSPAPDLAQALALMAAAGARGSAVTMWAPADPPERAAAARYVVGALRSIGFDARLELRPDLGSYFRAALDPANHAQIGMYSWGNDFPTGANTFFPMYACDGGLPHEFNPSRFCDARLSKRLDAALTGTSSEPTPARTWAALDHAFLDTAAMVPLVNTAATVVVSRRLENLVLHPQFGPLLELARPR